MARPACEGHVDADVTITLARHVTDSAKVIETLNRIGDSINFLKIISSDLDQL